MKCSKQIVDIGELNTLTDEELSYIRNGIYAYEGYYFESGYYNDYSWYEGSIPPDKFTEDMLSETQMKNVLSIQKIEKERSIHK